MKEYVFFYLKIKVTNNKLSKLSHDIMQRINRDPALKEYK